MLRSSTGQDLTCQTVSDFLGSHTNLTSFFVNRCFSAPSVEETLCGVSVNSSFVMLWCYGTSQPFSLCSADKLRTHRETEPNKKTLTQKNNDSSGVNFLVYPRKVPHSASDCASLCIESPYVEKAQRYQTPLVFAVDFYSNTSAKGTKNMRKPKWPQHAANDGAFPIFTVRQPRRIRSRQLKQTRS